MTRPLTYLASPYSHPDRAVRVARFEAAARAAARLASDGEIVFCPIAMSHPMAEAGELPGEWEFWERFDRAHLSVSRRIVVLTLDGWRESVGVQAEIVIAQELGLPVDYMEPEEND